MRKIFKNLINRQQNRQKTKNSHRHYSSVSFSFISFFPFFSTVFLVFRLKLFPIFRIELFYESFCFLEGLVTLFYDPLGIFDDFIPSGKVLIRFIF